MFCEWNTENNCSLPDPVMYLVSTIGVLTSNEGKSSTSSFKKTDWLRRLCELEKTNDLKILPALPKLTLLKEVDS